ncbi:NAD(P)-binding protein [Thelephora ganbajun]|uniref:NAD(P)-binding protein n=2 Tax=Thelephora ganbajun TaxID=370292 RepID=A0ACB6ZD40_THEGA|nr:NAD(P)-binding protein [Thelephora ganbajun]KAF9648547.1 NAD(P)-binding protein [Thelephora ganbajun]
MSQYGKRINQRGGEEFAAQTRARLETISTHLETAPRSGKLKGKVCVVTGAGSLKGIGRATALLFAHEGAAHLYLLDLVPHNLPELKETIQKKYPGVKVTTLQADAADETATSSVCEQALKDEGRLDVFFANAGMASASLLHDITSEEFMQSVRVNTLSAFLAVKHASLAMMKANPERGKPYGGGSIVLVASVAGIRSGAGPVHYSASKAAVNSIAQTSSYQLARTDVRVNSLCPGIIETSMTQIQFDYARGRGTEHKIGQLNPLGRYGISPEIANAVLFLASDDSSYINGQNICIDGGLSASHPVIPGKFT